MRASRLQNLKRKGDPQHDMALSEPLEVPQSIKSHEESIQSHAMSQEVSVLRDFEERPGAHETSQTEFFREERT